MKLKVNGNDVVIAVDENLSVKELLVSQDVNMPEYVTVQLNGEFLSLSDYETTFVKEGDAVEFLYFMGGGR